MTTTQEVRISDTLWERISPKLPVHVPKAHPLGCHKRRVPDRQVLDGIFFVLLLGYAPFCLRPNYVVQLSFWVMPHPHSDSLLA